MPWETPERVDRYVIDHEIGRGQMGVVYCARHEYTDREVALKILTADFAEAEMAEERFLREVRISASVDDPGVVEVYDAGEWEGTYYYAMELLEGRELSSAMADLTMDQGLAVVADAARSLAACHEEGVVHRDLKPDNIFLPEGDACTKILDFGVASVRDAARATQTGFTLGTPHYMSPEQARDARQVSPASDIWSLGVIVYEMATGTVPFDGESAMSVMLSVIEEEPLAAADRHRVPPRIDGLLDRALAKDPDERIGDAAEFAARIEQLRSDLGGEGAAARVSQESSDFVPRTLEEAPRTAGENDVDELPGELFSVDDHSDTETRDEAGDDPEGGDAETGPESYDDSETQLLFGGAESESETAKTERRGEREKGTLATLFVPPDRASRVAAALSLLLGGAVAAGLIWWIAGPDGERETPRGESRGEVREETAGDSLRPAFGAVSEQIRGAVSRSRAAPEARSAARSVGRASLGRAQAVQRQNDDRGPAAPNAGGRREPNESRGGRRDEPPDEDEGREGTKRDASADEESSDGNVGAASLGPSGRERDRAQSPTGESDADAGSAPSPGSTADAGAPDPSEGGTEGDPNPSATDSPEEEPDETDEEPSAGSGDVSDESREEGDSSDGEKSKEDSSEKSNEESDTKSEDDEKSERPGFIQF